MTRIPFAMLQLMRPHQWVKNAFVVAPLLFSGHMLDLALSLRTLLATLAFCLVSSAVYVFNDIRDIEADRAHTKKRKRPLPSGRISVSIAWGLLLGLLGGAAAVVAVLAPPLGFYLLLGVYLVVNLSYSMGLKHVAVLEIVMVSIGYIFRLIAGALVIGELLTDWIIVTTGLLALMLTVGKRRADLAQSNDEGLKRRSLERYTVGFLDHLMTAFAGATIVTYLLFCISEYAEMRFGNHVMWSAVLVTMGIIRFLQTVMVENQGDDPTMIVYKDPAMRAIVVVWGVFFLGLIYGA